MMPGAVTTFFTIRLAHWNGVPVWIAVGISIALTALLLTGLFRARCWGGKWFVLLTVVTVLNLAAALCAYAVIRM
jgi:hypothetical protein